MGNFERAREIMDLIPRDWPVQFGKRTALQVEIAYRIQRALDDAERRGRDAVRDEAKKEPTP